MAELTWSESIATFGNIGRNRDGGPSDLRREPEPFIRWKGAGYPIRGDNGIHGQLPRVELAIGSNDVRLVGIWHAREYPTRVKSASFARRPPPAAHCHMVTAFRPPISCDATLE